MTQLIEAASAALKHLEANLKWADEDCGEPSCDECGFWRNERQVATNLQTAITEAVKPCNWWQDGDSESDTWATDCGHYYTIIEGTPLENGMHHCCFCGQPLIEHPIEENFDD